MELPVSPVVPVVHTAAVTRELAHVRGDEARGAKKLEQVASRGRRDMLHLVLSSGHRKIERF